MNYYVYEYVREDGTPYYIGKGTGNRAWAKHERANGIDMLPPDISRIRIIKENLTSSEATDLEMQLIGYYGRKDIQSGILRNMTDGGDGAPGRIYSHSESTKEKISAALKGRPKKPFSDKHKARMSESALKRGPRIFSEQHKENMKKPKIRVICPHCKKEGASNIMKRFHFECCKELTKD
jgi:hypothetical protein